MKITPSVLLIMGFMVLFGSLSTILAKLMNQKVYSDAPTMEQSEFRHPLFMNILMFAGMSTLLPLYHLKKCYN